MRENSKVSFTSRLAISGQPIAGPFWLSCISGICTFALWNHSRTRVAHWVLRMKDSQVVFEPTGSEFYFRPDPQKLATATMVVTVFVVVLYAISQRTRVNAAVPVSVGGESDENGHDGDGSSGGLGKPPFKKIWWLPLLLGIVVFLIVPLGSIGVQPAEPPPDGLALIAIPTSAYEGTGWDAKVTLIDSSASVHDASANDEDLQIELSAAGLTVADDQKQIHSPTDVPLLYRWNARHHQDETNHEVAKQLGRRLRFLRAQAGLTQEQLAEGAEVGRPYLSALENSRASLPRYATLVRLASSLGVEVADLVRCPSEIRKATDVDKPGHARC